MGKITIKKLQEILDGDGSNLIIVSNPDGSIETKDKRNEKKIYTIEDLENALVSGNDVEILPNGSVEIGGRKEKIITRNQDLPSSY